MAEIPENLRLTFTTTQLAIAKKLYRIAGDSGHIKVRSIRHLAEHLKVHRTTLITTIKIIKAVNGNAIIIDTLFGTKSGPAGSRSGTKSDTDGTGSGTKNEQKKPRSKVPARNLESKTLDIPPTLEDKSGTPQGGSAAVSDQTLFNSSEGISDGERDVQEALDILRAFAKLKHKDKPMYLYTETTVNSLRIGQKKLKKHGIDLVDVVQDFAFKQEQNIVGEKKVGAKKIVLDQVGNGNLATWFKNAPSYDKADKADQSLSQGSTAIGDKVRAEMLAEKAKLEANQ